MNLIQVLLARFSRFHSKNCQTCSYFLYLIPHVLQHHLHVGIVLGDGEGMLGQFLDRVYGCLCSCIACERILHMKMSQSCVLLVINDDMQKHKIKLTFLLVGQHIPLIMQRYVQKHKSYYLVHVLNLPTRVTRSSMSRPLLANFSSWTSMESWEPGKFATSDASETNPSLRPVGTAQPIPPLWKY